MSRDGSGVVPGTLALERVEGSKPMVDSLAARRPDGIGAYVGGRARIIMDGSGVVPGTLELERVGGSKQSVDVAALRRPELMAAAVESGSGSFEKDVLAEGLPERRAPKTWVDRVRTNSSRFATDDEVMQASAVVSDSGVGAPGSGSRFVGGGIRRSRFAPEDGKPAIDGFGW